jgi:hypothetical protein
MCLTTVTAGQPPERIARLARDLPGLAHKMPFDSEAWQKGIPVAALSDHSKPVLFHIAAVLDKVPTRPPPLISLRNRVESVMPKGGPT